MSKATDQTGRSGAVDVRKAECVGHAAGASASDDSNGPCESDTESTASGSSSRRADNSETKSETGGRSKGGGHQQMSPDGSPGASASHGGADEPSVKRKRRPRPPTDIRLQCAVCGDAAFGYNFDAVSCESCKAFFRRNALRVSALTSST